MASENILVVARCRPFSEKESAAGHSKVVEINCKAGSITLLNSKNESETKTFSLDAVFDEDSTQVILLLFRRKFIMQLLVL
jgi:hypothetical protein